MLNTSDSKMFFLTRVIVCLSLLMISFNVAAQNQQHKPSYYVSRAESFIQSNSWTAAKREIDNGLEEWPDNADLRYLNGRYYYVTGHLNEARYNLIRAIQTNDQHYKAKRVMVDVEDASKHYSSAICYINELLEFQPYERDLWRRKISLYRKIHNNVDADAALERLARIYPNDSLVRSDLVNQRRRSVDKVVRQSSAEEAAIELEKWLETDPNNLNYYIELIGIYQRMGENDRAIGVGNRGLVHFPNNAELTNKIIGIYAEMGNYSQAMRIAQKSPSSSIYTNLLREAAADARIRDPYEMTGRLYAKTHDREALNYLLNTSLTRGYFDDARAYLTDAMQREGRSKSLLMKLYTLEKRMGNENAVRRVLEELYQGNLNDEELKLEYANMRLKMGISDINQQQWSDAEEHLRYAIDLMPTDNEAWPAAVSMRITCLARMNRFDDAKELFLKAAEKDYANRKRYASAYEEIVASRLHTLIEDEKYSEALSLAQGLLDVVPESETALRCCINMSQTLRRNDLFQKYAEMGYEHYPDSPYFVIKQAVALRQKGRNDEALILLSQGKRRNGEYEQPQYVAAYSGIVGEWATELLKEHLPDKALQIIDTALVYDPSNKELLYLKGIACEHIKDYDRAYDYQKRYYEPSNAEQSDYYEHIKYLGFRALRNRVDASYTRAMYDNHQDNMSMIAHLYSLASVSYSRVEKEDTYTGQISYKGIDGYHGGNETEAGGIGLEFMAQWEHIFTHRWSGMANIAYSTKFFNKIGANVSVSYAMEHGLTPSLLLGYRRTPKTYLYIANGSGMQEKINDEFSLFMITPSIEKAWERIRASVNTNLTVMGSSIYYNVGLRGKLFFNNDNISSVSLLTGLGTFPELTFFEQTALRNVSHTNAMVGFDAQYLFTRHLCIGLHGSWNTCFSPYIDANGIMSDSYRNIYSLTLQMHMAF